MVRRNWKFYSCVTVPWGENTTYPLGPHREALGLVKMQEANVAAGKHLLWLLWEGVGKVVWAGLGLANLNTFRGLGENGGCPWLSGLWSWLYSDMEYKNPIWKVLNFICCSGRGPEQSLGRTSKVDQDNAYKNYFTVIQVETSPGRPSWAAGRCYLSRKIGRTASSPSSQSYLAMVPTLLAQQKKKLGTASTYPSQWAGPTTGLWLHQTSSITSPSFTEAVL